MALKQHCPSSLNSHAPSVWPAVCGDNDSGALHQPQLCGPITPPPRGAAAPTWTETHLSFPRPAVTALPFARPDASHDSALPAAFGPAFLKKQPSIPIMQWVAAFSRLAEAQGCAVASFSPSWSDTPPQR